MARKKAMPMTNDVFTSMFNDIFLKLWKPSLKEGELTKEELAQSIQACDEIIEKYKKYTYEAVIKDNDGNDIRVESRPYVDDIALATLNIIVANEEEKREEQKKIIEMLQGL